MIIAFDTNVLAYAEGVNGTVMRDKALRLIARLPATSVSWRDAYEIVEPSATVIVNAMDLASDHGLTIWGLRHTGGIGGSRFPLVSI